MQVRAFRVSNAAGGTTAVDVPAVLLQDGQWRPEVWAVLEALALRYEAGVAADAEAIANVAGPPPAPPAIVTAKAKAS